MSYRMGFLVRMIATAVLLGAATLACAQAQQGSGGSDVVTEQFQDWEVRCPEDNSSDGRCEMTQLVDGPSGKPILRAVMGYPPNVDSAAMIFILPLGTRLAPGLQLSVDGDEPRGIPFQICLEQGCRADFPVKGELKHKLRAGRSAEISLIDPSGERIDLSLSLQGFTDADDRIQP